MDDTTKLVKAIQVIVQEEVKKQVQKIVRTGIKPIVQEEIERYFGKQKIAEIRKSKPTSNRKQSPSMLDESVVYDSSDFDDRSEWPTMQHSISPKAGTPRVHMEGMEDLLGMPVGANIDTSNPATRAVANAMTRDYSSLMKTIYKKE